MSHTLARIEMLLVEDNPPDVKLLEECLREAKFPYHLSVVNDGEAALAFLQRHAPYTEAPRPALMLLDIHLPKQSGWEVLAWVRATPSLTSIPVVILTGVFSPFDEERIEQLQPTRCLVKPREMEDFLRVGQAIEKVISQHNSLSLISRGQVIRFPSSLRVPTLDLPASLPQ